MIMSQLPNNEPKWWRDTEFEQYGDQLDILNSLVKEFEECNNVNRIETLNTEFEEWFGKAKKIITGNWPFDIFNFVMENVAHTRFDDNKKNRSEYQKSLKSKSSIGIVAMQISPKVTAKWKRLLEEEAEILEVESQEKQT